MRKVIILAVLSIVLFGCNSEIKSTFHGEIVDSWTVNGGRLDQSQVWNVMQNGDQFEIKPDFITGAWQTNYVIESDGFITLIKQGELVEITVNASEMVMTFEGGEQLKCRRD